MKLIDLTYYTNTEFSSPAQMLNSHKTSLGYLEFIKTKVNIQVIKHLNYRGHEAINNMWYSFFKSKNHFFHIPFETHKYIKKEKPDVVLVQGLTFPFQVVFLRRILPPKSKIIVQHHGEFPYNGIKKAIQKFADKYIDAYLFTAKDNALAWIEKGIISNMEKCHEVLEASAYFTKQDKQESRQQLGITGKNIFLWVGRLAKNKDPLTALRGFETYLKNGATAELYMIYQEEDLLADVKGIISNSPLLRKSVHLIGRINHNELPCWFSASDFYLSASHAECAGYALIEAMACGCIPIVTSIPPFKKIAAHSGFFFETGNAESLYHTLIQLPLHEKERCSAEVTNQFNNKLSFKTIAEDIYRIGKSLSGV